MKYFRLLASSGFFWLDVLWMVYTHQTASTSVIVFFVCLFAYWLACNRTGRWCRKDSEL